MTRAGPNRPPSAREGPTGPGGLASVPGALFATDAAWRLTLVNGHAEAFLQRPEEDLIGEDLWAACPALAGAPFEDAFRRVVRDGASARFTAYHAPTATWYDVSVVPAEGGLSVYLADMTDRERQGSRLRLLQEAVEVSPNGVVITSAAGDYAVLYVNPAFTSITGFDPADVIETDWRLFLKRHPGNGSGQAALDNLMEALHACRPCHVVLKDHRRDGSLFWTEIDVAPVEGPDGGVSHLVCVLADVTGRVEADQAQRLYAGRLQALSRRLVDVQEAERRSLARELHDEIGQELTALKLMIEEASRVPEAAAALVDVRPVVQQILRRVRDLSLDLRPPMLEDFGLASALQWLGERLERQTGLRVLLRHPAPLPPLPPDVATGAFRITQEALTNVVRHAGVSEAEVAVEVCNDLLIVTIADAGAGFDRVAALAGWASSGLTGMHERARLLGGHLDIVASPGQGTRLTARFPLTSTPHADADHDHPC
ncbi:MAG TPA: PAS domain-containing protein [Rubricoccaceae bacterium]